MSFLGRDELRLRFKNKETHWIDRKTLKTSNNFRKQF